VTHTPGPWFFDEVHSASQPRAQYEVRNEKRAVANCFELTEENRANARLIAAAPDLFAAARSMAAIDDGWLASAHERLLREAIKEIRNEARSAIAKAEAVS
jgi:hypothetical protein